MKNKLLPLALVGVMTISLAACGGGGKQTAGTVLGGAAGGAACSGVGGGSGRVAAVIGCTLIGAAIGGSIGHSMDELDRMKTQRALEQAPVNQPVAWRNPDTGVDYTVTPTRTYYDEDRSPCREYSTEAVIDGKREVVYGTACREPDGSWRVQS